MTEQVIKKIEAVAEVFIGGDAPAEYTDTPTGEYKIPIYSNGVENEGLYGFAKESRIPAGSTTVSARGNIGTVFYRKQAFLPIVRLISLVPKPGEIVPKYLYYILKSIQIIGTGSAQPQVTAPQIKRKKLLCFSDMATQCRIADVLSTYDDLIENNNRRIKLLEQMAENLYKEWFVRFRFPGHETAEFENGLPKGWAYQTVESLSGLLRRGISPEYDDDGALTVISQKCIRAKIMDISEARKQTKVFSEELNLIDGDTVICSTGTGTLGRVGQVYGAYPNTTFDSHVTLVRAKAETGKHFLFYSLSNIQIWLMNMGVGSTNQQELYAKIIKNAKILVPNDTKLIKLFERSIEQIHQMIISLVKKNDLLVRQRDLLLPRLMSGKLEV